MRKILLASLLTGVIALSGCATTNPDGTPINWEAFLTNVRDVARDICGVVVPVADIAKLVSADPSLTTASAIAKLICSSIAATQGAAARMLQHGMSGAVVIHGVEVHYKLSSKQ